MLKHLAVTKEKEESIELCRREYIEEGLNVSQSGTGRDERKHI